MGEGGLSDVTSAMPTDGALDLEVEEVDRPTMQPGRVTSEDFTLQWRAPSSNRILARGEAASVTATGPDRFETVREAGNALLDRIDGEWPTIARPRLFGGFSFFDDHEAVTPWVGFPAARFVLPRVYYVETDSSWYRCHFGEEPVQTPSKSGSHLGQPVDILEQTPSTSRERWDENVATILDRIRSGSIKKAVLAQALEVGLAGELDPSVLFHRLDERYPDCFCFAIHPQDSPAFVGATPELLISRSGSTIASEVLAGSAARRNDSDEDVSERNRLRQSPKNQREHSLATDRIRDELGPLTETLDVGEQEIRSLRRVQHLRTPMEATLSEPVHVLSLVDRLHPTPTVGGVPLEEAISTVRTLEGFERGWYASPIGWFDRSGNGEFAVGIRSALVDDTRLHLFAGAGIVEDSDPTEEWDEVQLKYQPILEALR